MLQGYIKRYGEFRYYYGAADADSVRFDEKDAELVSQIYQVYTDYLTNVLKQNPHVIEALKNNNYYLLMVGNTLFISFEGKFK